MELKRRPVIIVDGPDNCGKTTLVEQLAKRFDVPVRKSPGPRPRWALEGWTQTQMEYMFQVAGRDIGMYHDRGLIYDRFPVFNEPIYGPNIRGRFGMNPLVWLNFIMELKAAKVIVVYCRPPGEKIRETWDHRPQMEGVFEHLDAIIMDYDQLMLMLQNLGITVFEYDWTKDPDQKEIIAQIARRQRP